MRNLEQNEVVNTYEGLGITGAIKDRKEEQRVSTDPPRGNREQDIDDDVGKKGKIS